MTTPPGPAAITATDVLALTDDPWPLPGVGTRERWQRLADVAAQDLPLVKVVEPHHDAHAILVELDGRPPARGQIWGVWAAEPPSAVLTAEPSEGGWRLTGSKAFCSGADLVTHALVTARTPDGPGLFAVDRSSPGITHGQGPAWEGVGMRRADTRTLDFYDVVAEQVGAPGDYTRRPGFWMGGLGIAACWWGGARGVAGTLEAASARLDAHGLAHLGAVRSALDVTALALDAAAARLDRGGATTAEVERLALTLRSHVADVVETTIRRVGRACGPAPLAFDADHAQRVADLQVFVRQHHAERDLERLGASRA